MTAGVVLVQDGDSRALLLSVEGLPEDVDAEERELRTALESAGAPAPNALEAPNATQAWAEFLAEGEEEACLVRVGVPPQYLHPYWSMVQQHEPGTAWLFDIAAGHVYARKSVAPMEVGGWLAALRQPALALRGYAVVLAAPDAVMNQIDRWGYRPDGIAIMRRLKAALGSGGDPQSGRIRGVRRHLS